jgi:pimeloyl-ACP methyl ester carboxylesterase
MWLLDVNLPTALVALLREYGLTAETAAARGWRTLTNGVLASATAQAGFQVLLTRDRGFGRSATSVLATLPELAIVVVTLPQAREASYLRAFAEAWRVDRIRPVPGAIIEWPSS